MLNRDLSSAHIRSSARRNGVECPSSPNVCASTNGSAPATATAESAAAAAAEVPACPWPPRRAPRRAKRRRVGVAPLDRLRSRSSASPTRWTSRFRAGPAAAGGWGSRRRRSAGEACPSGRVSEWRARRAAPWPPRVGTARLAGDHSGAVSGNHQRGGTRRIIREGPAHRGRPGVGRAHRRRRVADRHRPRCAANDAPTGAGRDAPLGQTDAATMTRAATARARRVFFFFFTTR